MKSTIKIITVVILTFVIVGVGTTVITQDVDAYAQRSNSVSKDYTFERYNSSTDIRTISNGTVTVNHKVDMIKGGYQMCIGEEIDFAYDDEFTFVTGNGFWDTPNAAWCSAINTMCKSIYEGQKVYDGMTSNWWMGKWPQPGYSEEAWFDKGVREDRILEAYILWTGVKNLNPQGMYSYMLSSNPSVVSCYGMDCTVLKDGKATLTAYARRAQARIWAYVEFNNPTHNWSWVSEGSGPYLNKEKTNAMWMSDRHTKIGTWDITVGAAQRCDYCGDGKLIQPGEECDTSDPANPYLIDDCTVGYDQMCEYCVSPGKPGACTLVKKRGPYCGDGVVNGTEQCDAGAQNGVMCTAAYDGDCTYCDNFCMPKTVTGPYCGDGVQNGSEQCDDGNTNDNDGCFNDCTRPCACGPDNNTFQDNAPINLCDPGAPISLTSTGGQWIWNCGVNTQCSVADGPCIARCLEVELDVPSGIYLSKNGNDKLKASVRVKGNALNGGTCTISFNGNDKVVPVNGNKTETVELPFVAPGGEVKAECTLTEDCDRNGSGSTDLYIDRKNVSALCTEKKCNAQGTCQGTPRDGITSLSDCSSTCNSNADCSRGRMIETRP